MMKYKMILGLLVFGFIETSAQQNVERTLSVGATIGMNNSYNETNLPKNNSFRITKYTNVTIDARYFISKQLFAGLVYNTYQNYMMDTLLKSSTTINGYNNVSNAKGALYGLQLGFYKELSNKFGFSFAVGYMNGTQVNKYTNQYLYETPATSYRNKIKTIGEETIKLQRITFTPQLFYFINSNFILNVTLSNKSYNFNTTKNVSTEENSVITFNSNSKVVTQNSTESKSSNLDLNLSVSNLSFGINYFFRPKQKKAQ